MLKDWATLKVRLARRIPHPEDQIAGLRSLLPTGEAGVEPSWVAAVGEEGAPRNAVVVPDATAGRRKDRGDAVVGDRAVPFLGGILLLIGVSAPDLRSRFQRAKPIHSLGHGSGRQAISASSALA